MDQSNLLQNMMKFDKKLYQDQKKIREKRNTYKSAYALYEGRELTLDAFKKWNISNKKTQRKGLKILTPKQMLRGLPIALA